jgi:Zn-dependent M28 family amino/carboxypeptidase
MNVWGPTRNFSMSGSARLDLVDDLIAEGKREGRAFAPDPHPEAGHFFRSDHFSFAKVGVPAVSFDSGDDMVNGGVARGEALAAEYVTKHYHQPSDEWSPQWDFSGLAGDAAMLHAVGEHLANSREWPNWASDSEFRAARDRSAADRNGAPAAGGKGERG